MFEGNWLDLLKASGWQFACLALACAAALFGDHRSWLPIALDPTFKQATILAFFVFVGLWFASIGQAATKSLSGPRDALRRRLARRTHANQFRDYIPFMTEREKAVIAQLLHQNRKSFSGSSDGGYAAPLIGRGFIKSSLARNQTFDLEDVPYLLPDHIWEVAAQNRDVFKYVPDPSGGDAWRIHWMAR